MRPDDDRPDRPGSGPQPAWKDRLAARIQALVPAFLAHRRQDVATLRQALQQEDFETVRRLGHQLKGSGSAYGFHALTAVGHALEQAALDRNPQAVNTWIEIFATALEAGRLSEVPEPSEASRAQNGNDQTEAEHPCDYEAQHA